MSVGNIVFTILLILFIVLIVIFLFLNYKVDKDNKNAEKLTKMHTFFQYYGKNVQRKDGTPQISCPVGTHVNIIDARFQVYDPYLQCSEKPIANAKINDVCGGPMNLNGTAGTGNCRINDATGYLGSICNGKQSCSVLATSEFFGPEPCGLAPTGSKKYDELPNIAGAPHSKDKAGFAVSGLYTCVKNNPS